MTKNSFVAEATFKEKTSSLKINLQSVSLDWDADANLVETNSDSCK